MRWSATGPPCTRSCSHSCNGTSSKYRFSLDHSAPTRLASGLRHVSTMMLGVTRLSRLLQASMMGALTAATITACTPSDETDADSNDSAVVASDVESGGFYHWSEGGDVIPLFALRALQVTVNGKKVSFLSDENLSRFGLLP